MRMWLRFFAICAVAGLTFVGHVRADDKDDEKPVALHKLPKLVTDAIHKMFPMAELIEATEEADDEDDEVEYEVTIRLKGKKIDVTVSAAGKIEEFEQEIDVKELPKSVIDAIEKKFPKSSHLSAEAVYSIRNGKEKLKYYEVEVETADKKAEEVMINAAGEIIAKNKEEQKDKQPKSVTKPQK
jgi:uncharacterized membrane protein YkoI